MRHGRCVQLRQGDPDAEMFFGDNPAEMAQHWVSQGADWLHIVNLDGALDANQSLISALERPSNILVQHPGDDAPENIRDTALQQLPINLQRLSEIRAAVDVPIQFGGGLRTLDDIRLALKLGATRVILGTVAVEKPELVRDAIDIWGHERIVVGIDARDGKVATHGWQKTSEVTAIDLGHQMHALGVRRVLYTDINRDGMLSGVNVAETARLGDVTGLHVIASGGVAAIADIERVKEHEHYNIEGVIAGTSLYKKTLDLATAIQVGRRPLRRRSAGIVPYRQGEDGPEFLLLFNLFFEQWQFPRGMVEAGEDDQAAAAREFSLETGLPLIKLEPRCRTVLEYTSAIRGYDIERTIVYFLGEIGAGEVRLGNENHCEARWLSPQETWELLTETSPEQLPAYDAAMACLQVGLKE